MTMREMTFEKDESPSPRRAWIEIFKFNCCLYCKIVALPTEGVD